MCENFNFRNVNTRLRLLTEGHRLLMVHQVYGNYIFSMNPQQNVIYASRSSQGEYDYDPEDPVRCHPEKFLLWGVGEWFIEIEMPGTKIIEVPGKYERI